MLLLKLSPLWGACWSSSHLPGAPWGPDWTTGLPLPRLHCTTSWPSEALTTLGMLRRTEPSTTVILLASVISPLQTPPPSPRRVGRREGAAKIFRCLFLSVLVCVAFPCPHSPWTGHNRVQTSKHRFNKAVPLATACNIIGINTRGGSYYTSAG